MNSSVWAAAAMEMKRMIAIHGRAKQKNFSDTWANVSDGVVMQSETPIDPQLIAEMLPAGGRFVESFKVTKVVIYGSGRCVPDWGHSLNKKIEGRIEFDDYESAARFCEKYNRMGKIPGVKEWFWTAVIVN